MPKAPPRTLLIVLAVLVVAVAGAALALRILLPPDTVLALARRQLAASVRREVRLEGASVSLWPPVRARLEGIAIGEQRGLASGAMLRADAFDCDLDVLALLGRKIRIRSLTLRHPQLHVVTRQDGSSNLDSLMKAAGPSPPRGPLDLAIQSLTLHDGELLLDDARAGRRTLLHLDSRISLSIERGSRFATDGHTTLSGFARGPISAARISDLDHSLADLTVTIDHRGKFDGPSHRLALDRLAIGLGKAEIAFRGLVEDPGPRARLDLTAKGSGIEFGEVLRALSAASLPALHGVTGAGHMDCDLRIAGALGQARLPSVTGLITVRDASFRYPKAPAGIRALSFDAHLAPDSIGVAPLSARVADQLLRGTFSVMRFSDPHVRFRLAGAVDLGAIAPLVAPPGTDVSGIARLDVAGSGPIAHQGAMSVTGRADLAGVRIADPKLPKPIDHISGAIALSGTRASVTRLTGTAGQSSFTLDATVDRPMAMMAKSGTEEPAAVSFTMASPMLDLAELLPPTPGPMVMPNARGTGRVSIAHLKRGKLDAKQVSADVSFDRTTMTVPRFSMASMGGNVTGNASFDLRDASSPGFSVDAKVDSVSADEMLSTWTPAHGLLKGSMSTTLKLSSAGTTPSQVRRTLTAIGLAVMGNGELGPAPVLTEIAKVTGIPSFEKLSFREVKMPFEVRNGQIAMKEVDIHSSGSDWKAAGLLGFDGSLDYRVSTLVPADQVARLGARAALAAGALADRDGRVHIGFRVTGNAKNPRVGIDAQTLKEDLAGHLQNVLGDQGRKIEQQLDRAVAPAESTGTRPNLEAIADSLKKIKGSDLLNQLFGKKKKSAPPPDTSHPAPADTAHH
ncbi:MAG TPA: AsmA-like C-terminal region-containing protein [Candidatus Udaeobacter sp.]|jgi:hypothetical protein|nr:AsmA-like C-terminal region-containing protein [Candidatus Udaeobacter sp.]